MSENYERTARLAGLAIIEQMQPMLDAMQGQQAEFRRHGYTSDEARALTVVMWLSSIPAIFQYVRPEETP